ncbi:LytR C-terminal domain-containing protein [Nocardioides sp. 1609]|uniref:LytR C-terminal domain-containing protein n=1 Tax=Nocardioides sp. 1609 TaxID=2508327 RepID=UPI00142F955F|nr:LytR C-terminal domain-containing protein [Nocardioides sp. 1609]
MTGLKDVSPSVLGHVRTIVTLAVLALLLALGVSRGLNAVSEPFPESADPPICVDEDLTAGDILRPAQLTVNVLNAGERTGLAGVTIEDLQAQGFARGSISNLTGEDVASVEIWSPQGRTPAVRLVAGYLTGKVDVVERGSSSDGITVVVGDKFPGVRAGKEQIVLKTDVTVCSPADLG